MSMEIGRWATCEAQAFHDHPGPGPGRRMRVSTWLRREVHRAQSTEPGAMVAYDGQTPTASIARWQARAMREALWGLFGELESQVRQVGENRSLYIVEQRRNFSAGMIHASVGVSDTVWLDLGERLDEYEGDLDFAAVIHIARSSGHKEIRVELMDSRPVGPLVDAYRAFAAAREDVVSRQRPPTRSPGRHCGRCRLLGCPIRLVSPPE